MTERWIARLSLFLAVSMIVGLFGVWGAAGREAGSPLVTVGVSLASVEDGVAVYGVQVRNQGTEVAQGVRVSDHLPEGLSVLRAVPGGNCDETSCEWSVGELAPGAAQAFLLEVAVDTSERLRARSRAVVTADNAPTNTHVSRTLRVSRSAEAMAAPEDASCIDVDPETGSGPSDGEIQYAAFVTDGAKVGTGETDACDGGPVADVQVVWVIEDDDPDAWISNQDGTPTSKTIQEDNANPNSVTTVTKADGTTFIRIQLHDPTTSGEGRYSGHFGEDVAEPGSDPLCDIPIIGPECPGEAANEDDVVFSWSAPTATPTPTGSPTPTPTSTGTPTPTPTETEPQKSERQVSIDSKDAAKSGTQVTFTGFVSSGEPTCAGDQFVRIQRRQAGEETFSEFTSTQTDANGNYAVLGQVDHNAEYVAVLGETETCAEATSTPTTTLAKAAVSGSARPARPKRGKRFKITGTVAPDKSGTNVLLQRRKNRRFRTIKSKALGPDSDYSFNVRARFKKRVFRVLWKSQDELNEQGGRRIRVRTRR